MCCQDVTTFELPASVIEMIGAYRLRLAQHGWDWGEEGAELFRLGRLFEPIVSHMTTTFDIEGAFRSALDELANDIVVVTADEQGVGVRTPNPPLHVLPGGARDVDVVVVSRRAELVEAVVDGETITVPPGALAVRTMRIGAGAGLAGTMAGQAFAATGILRTTAAATLRLESACCTRWSVTDDAGGAWFPDGVLQKWDSHGRPFFHADRVELQVPSTTLDVVCARGLEYAPHRVQVRPEPGELVVAHGEPTRVFDPAANGWYGGDMHVHLNYSGDLVCTPEDAARMQVGEGLHVMNLVAANMLRSQVYDRAMLDEYAGEALPWSSDDVLAATGVEYRNDLLGHVHAFAPTAAPTCFYAGHEHSDHPEDWPPNSVALDELRRLDATVGYCHPVLAEFGPDGATDRFFMMPRSTECRELVADAALGLVDSIDLVAPTSNEGAAYLYHRLLSCGIQLAATAGTDAFLSFSRTTPHSNPPGWGRVYAEVGDAPLTLDSYKAAIRAGRTLVTNGPWIDLSIDGHGPGSTLDVASGERLSVRVQMRGAGAEQLVLVTADGVLASSEGETALDLEFVVDRPTWVAAIVRGGRHDVVLDRTAFAHTSPVWIDVGGRRVARAEAARWCLQLLDGVEQLVRTHGHFHDDTRDAHLGDVVGVLEQARDAYRQVIERSN